MFFVLFSTHHETYYVNLAVIGETLLSPVHYTLYSPKGSLRLSTVNLTNFLTIDHHADIKVINSSV